MSMKTLYFYLLFIFLISSSSTLAVGQLSLSNLKVFDADGITEISSIDGYYTFSRQQTFYLQFDITNIGDNTIGGNGFNLYSIINGRSYPIYTVLSQDLGFELIPGGTLSNWKMKVQMDQTNTLCGGDYNLIGSTLNMNIHYGDPTVNCYKLEVTSFEFLESSSLSKHPYYIKNEGGTKYGFRVKIKNTGTADFLGGNYRLQCSGRPSLQSINQFGINLDIPADGIPVTLELSSENYCQIDILGYNYIYIYDSSNNLIKDLINPYTMGYYTGNPIWYGKPAASLSSLIIKPGDTVNVYQQVKVVLDTDSLNPQPSLGPILAGSTYKLWVEDTITKQHLCEYPTKTLISDTSNTFGTLPTAITKFDDFSCTFNEGSEVPEKVTIYTELKDKDSNSIFSINTFNNPEYKIIDLTPLLNCNVENNIGCDCISSLNPEEKTYTFTCSMVRSAGFIVLKKYIGKFLFSNLLESELQKNPSRLLEVKKINPDLTSTIIPSINYILGNSVEMNIVPKPVTSDSGPEVDYVFTFNCDLDKDSYLDPVCGGNDCNDNDPLIYPGAQEVCDNIDNDCSGIKDDNIASRLELNQNGLCLGNKEICSSGIWNSAPENYKYVSESCTDNSAYDNIDNDCSGDDLNCDSYCDADGDGYTTHMICLLALKLPGDCDDNNALINPGEVDIPCDNIDQDCSNGAFQGTDVDNDGYKTEGGLCGLIDCNDNDPLIYPGAQEVCDNIDNDCSGIKDDNLVAPNNLNQNGVCTNSLQSCINGEWKDDYFSITDYQEIEMLCNDGIDNNCNGLIDCADSDCSTNINCCIDNDGDAYSTNGETCGPIDCDDTTNGVDNVLGTPDDGVNINPGANEVCGNSIDENCDGVDEECILTGCDLDDDLDDDTYISIDCSGNDCNDNDPLIHPGAQEVCDGKDNDCDGYIDTIPVITIQQGCEYGSGDLYGNDGIISQEDIDKINLLISNNLYSPVADVNGDKVVDEKDLQILEYVLNENSFECSDGLDNDGDCKIDLNDLECDDIRDDTEEQSECSDKIDNDNDGAIDYPNDSGCTDSNDNSEYTAPPGDGSGGGGGGGGSSHPKITYMRPPTEVLRTCNNNAICELDFETEANCKDCEQVEEVIQNIITPKVEKCNSIWCCWWCWLLLLLITIGIIIGYKYYKEQKEKNGNIRKNNEKRKKK